MNEYAVFAFVVTPAIVIAVAYLLYRVDEHFYRRRHKHTPAE